MKKTLTDLALTPQVLSRGSRLNIKPDGSALPMSILFNGVEAYRIIKMPKALSFHAPQDVVVTSEPYIEPKMETPPEEKDGKA